MIKVIATPFGNWKAIINAYKQLGVMVEPAFYAEDLSTGSQIVLPGVGNFGPFCEYLREKSFLDSIKSIVNQDKKILGVCVGMQSLFEASTESPGV